MAQVDKLVKVGSEAFALLDEAKGRKKKPAGSRVGYWGLQVIIVREPVIDSDQAAQLYGGISVVDHRMRKPICGVY